GSPNQGEAMKARWTLFASVLAVGVGSLAFVAEPEVAHAVPGCSLGTLDGDYLGNIAGTIATEGDFGLQYHLGLDGDGTGTVERAVLMTESAPGPVLFVGTVTYTLSAQCTGALTVTSDFGVRNYAIAVASKGSELFMLAVNEGTTGT